MPYFLDMRIRVSRLILLILFISINCVVSLFAQDTHTRFVNISLREGLENASVSSIVQDAAGFLWFGTQGGLHRYDGHSFQVYENEPFDEGSLPHNLIQTMFLDTGGEVIWIGTYGGLTRFDTRTQRFQAWHHDAQVPDSLVNDVVISIARDRDGRLWVGTLEGLDRFDEKTGTFIHYTAKKDDPAMISSGLIRSLLLDSRGQFWVGTSGGGLYRYLQDTDSFSRVRPGEKTANPFPSDYIMSVKEDSAGILWIGAWFAGICSYNPINGESVYYKTDDDRIYFVNAQDKKRVYAGTWGGGLFELDKASAKITRYQKGTDREWSIAHDTVYSMFIDNSGETWIGTNGGGFSHMLRDPEGFMLYAYEAGNPASRSSGKTNAVLEDSKGRIWVGTYNGGLDRLDPGAKAFRHYRYDKNKASSLPNDIITCLYEDSTGSIWILTNAGFARYLEASDSFERYTNDPKNPDSLSDPVVYSMVEEPGTGNFWIGTYTKGLEYWNRKTGKFMHFPAVVSDPKGLSANLIYAMTYDSKGRLWIGTNDGLNRYNGDGTFAHYKNDPADIQTLTSKIIRELHVDSKGVLWIATNGGGVNQYDETTDSFRHWTKRDGLSSNVVNSILSDSLGNIWVATATGLSVMEPATNRFRPYTANSELRYSEFSGGRFRNKNGVLYFGAFNALFRIDPKLMKENKANPVVRFTGINLNSGPLNPSVAPWFDQDVKLEWNNDYIAFTFAALAYKDPLLNQYAYMLEGFDEDWVYSGSRYYASYTNLPGGKYRFRVKASNSDGVWNEEGSGILMEVSTAPWLRWWAILLYVLFLGGMIGVLFVIRSRALLSGKVMELSKLKLELENANEKLEDMASHDGLTGLFNRRALTLELSRRFAAAINLQEPLGVLMADIDHFKPFNDCYGHQAGDECLMKVADVIKKSLDRQQDTVSRYGGEEFIVLLPGVSAEGLAKVAERIRAAVQNLHIQHEASDVEPSVTLSIGGASFVPSGMEEMTRLVEVADNALYQAKKAGRNRVVVVP